MKEIVINLILIYIIFCHQNGFPKFKTGARSLKHIRTGTWGLVSKGGIDGVGKS